MQLTTNLDGLNRVFGIYAAWALSSGQALVPTNRVYAAYRNHRERLKT